MARTKVTRKSGRPPVDPAGGGSRVTVRLSDAMYDAAYAIASARGVDVAVVIRDWIQRGVVADRRTSLRPQ